MTRSGLKSVLSEKILEVFNWFENELEEVQKLYESQKVRSSGFKILIIAYSITIHCLQDF